MVSTYPACFFKEDNVYSVVFPDLNWLATSGNTEIEAMNNAVECLAGYLYMLKVDNLTVFYQRHQPQECSQRTRC